MGVGGGEADRPFERRGIEVLGAKQTAEISERGGRLRREFLGERRRNKPAVQADKQRIGEDVAQPRQRPAHRRLAQADFGRRVGDVAPPEQRLQRRQQIEVEPG